MTDHLKSDSDMLAYLRTKFPGAWCRANSEWNEYQATPRDGGLPDYERPETVFIDRGHDRSERALSRAEFVEAVGGMVHGS